MKYVTELTGKLREAEQKVVEAEGKLKKVELEENDRVAFREGKQKMRGEDRQQQERQQQDVVTGQAHGLSERTVEYKQSPQVAEGVRTSNLLAREYYAAGYKRGQEGLPPLGPSRRAGLKKRYMAGYDKGLEHHKSYQESSRGDDYTAIMKHDIGDRFRQEGSFIHGFHSQRPSTYDKGTQTDDSDPSRALYPSTTSLGSSPALSPSSVAPSTPHSPSTVDVSLFDSLLKHTEDMRSKLGASIVRDKELIARLEDSKRQ